MNVKEGVSMLINGKPYTVPNDVPGNTSLNSFIRNYAHLRGTKFMCLEGGCGSCIVEAKIKHPSTGRYVFQAVNSCLIPVFSCHGWSITTVEGIGNKIKGYHDIQKRLTKNSGTQCGYCSPGMVMNMYSLIRDNPKITMAEVENSFAGNMCRCTGYRPILEAFKSFASDAPKELVQKCVDIEDLTKICPKTGKNCNKTCSSDDEHDTEVIDCMGMAPKFQKYKLQDGSTWYRVADKKEIFEVLDMADDNAYMIVGGNTAHGVYRVIDPLPVYIDIGRVAELHDINNTSDTIILGGNVSLNDAMAYFNKISLQKNSPFAYTKVLADHIDLIANVPVRNAGTLAGNLSIKHKHHEFPSDIFLILETVGAMLVIEDNSGMEQTISLVQYLGTDMNKQLLTKILLPAIDSNSHVLRTYKIMPRAQNAHAYVNAGFLFKVNKDENFKVLEKPTIVIGGIHPDFIHAIQTENFLTGKSLLEEETLKRALKVLQDELKPDHVLPDGTPEFRKGLATTLFYKCVLSLSPEHLHSRNRSGGEMLNRPLSSAKQDYDTDEKMWPVNKPIPKIEGLYQCSGEAEYVNDIQTMPGELHGAFVLAKKATASSFTLNASHALKIPGVVAFYTAKDIPGNNNFTPKVPAVGLVEVEEVFASEKIQFAGQALGLIVADSHDKALYAASKVLVYYEGLAKPVTDVWKIINSGDTQRIYSLVKKEAKDTTKADVKHKINGKFSIKGQYHYTMETQSCLCIPIEDGIDVYATTQWSAFTQQSVSYVLNMPLNRVNVQVRRVGGGYGCKLTRNSQIASACAVASYKLQKPVKIVLSIETNMEMCGKRIPCYANYDVGVDDNGKIQCLNLKFYEDDGYVRNDLSAPVTLGALTNLYDDSTWNVEGFGVRTDVESSTWCRAPGSAEGVAVIENLMEHIANVVKKDPIEVRLINMKSSEEVLPKLISDIKTSSEYHDRVAAIEQFNKATKICCEQILKRLEPLKNENPNSSWKDLVKLAASKSINLNASHMFTSADDVKSYSIYGTAVIEVIIDLLTGQHLILRADIIEDAGISLSPEVDIGQVEGSYIMGLGYYLSEELVRHEETGQLLTNRTWNYKIPGVKDIPIDFRVQLRKNAPNPVGVLRSKATGEPPLCMSVGVLFAVRNALESARKDAGLKEDWFSIDAPFTGERIWTGAATSLNQCTLYRRKNLDWSCNLFKSV